MKLSKENNAKTVPKEEITGLSAKLEPTTDVRTANFDKQALDKKVRLGYLHNMLMADVARKDAIKQANDTQKVSSKKKIRTAMIFKDEDIRIPDAMTATESNNETDKSDCAGKCATLNRSFAEQRRHASDALEKLELPDSPSYNLLENQVDFNPHNVVVPSRVDVHQTKVTNKLMNDILSWLVCLCTAVVIAFVFVTFIAQRNIVDGSSMYPTLYNGDNLIVEKVSRYFSLPHYGDIITFIKPKFEIVYSEDSSGNIKREIKEKPDKPDLHLVKRVIGLPGDNIEIKDGAVYRNDSKLTEGYLSNKIITKVEDPSFAKVTLAADEVYVLGDNREHSSDSRYFGPIKLKSIVGRSLFRFYPINRVGIPR